ncbi:MAG TPA: superoxide dismutase family protein [Allosphingosinicella sp.]|jgi:Cu-Zn family superoxide dismutase
MKTAVAACAATLLAGCAMNSQDRPSERVALGDAEVALIGPDGSHRGTVRMLQTHGSLLVRVRGVNLPPGTHGAHVHAVGRCDLPDFASAGPHWNPTGRQHGRDNPAGAHLGDAPNLVIGADGRGTIEFEIADAWMRRGATPVLDGDGGAFVIHANPDDHRTDPSGNSGARIACAVLR